MAEARSLGLPPHPTFRSQSGTGRCQEQHGEILIEASEWALQPQPRVGGKVRPLIPRRALLARGPQAFFLAWVFLLLSVPIRICQFF